MAKVAKTLKGVVTAPVQTVKAGIKAVAKPADTAGVGQVAIGAIASLPLGWAYSKGYDHLVTLLPAKFKESVLIKIFKFAFPLAPMYFIHRFKVPFGTLINGCLLGIFVTQIALEIYGFIKGTSTKEFAETASVNNPTNKYAEW